MPSEAASADVCVCVSVCETVGVLMVVLTVCSPPEWDEWTEGGKNGVREGEGGLAPEQ